MLLAGCGASQKPITLPATMVPTATATVPSGFRVYRDPAGYFQLDVPQDWTASTLPAGNSGTGFKAPDQAADLAVIYVPGTTLTSSDITSATTKIFQSASTRAGGNGTFAHVQGPSQMTIGGASWTKEEADVNIGAGNSPLHSVVLLVDHNHTAFIISYAAINFASVQSQDYGTMLSTFKFLK